MVNAPPTLPRAALPGPGRPAQPSSEAGLGSKGTREEFNYRGGKFPALPSFGLIPLSGNWKSLGQEREGAATERKVKYHKDKADPDSVAFLQGSANACSCPRT